MTQLIIHQSEHERRLAVHDGNTFLEFDSDDQDNHAIVGAVYCGRVLYVTADYALLDVDRARPAFLQKTGGLKEGDLVFVQVKREELMDVGEQRNGGFKKGLVVTKNIELVTPYFVFNPLEKGIAVSKNVKDAQRLTELGQNFLQERMGKFLLRSKAENATEVNLCNAMELMEKTWSMTTMMGRKPSFLLSGRRHMERLLDQYAPQNIYTDSIQAYWDVQTYLATYPYPAEVSNRQHNVFEEFGVSEEWDTLISPWIQTPSGGNLTIESTTTFTCIDINQGKSTLSLDALNREAAHILAQIFMKIQLNGNVIVDFAGNLRSPLQEEILGIVQKTLPGDTRYLGWSKMGWLEMRRPRVRLSLLESLKKKDAL